jgi:two-component system response regulator PilR (NtrC family)
MDEIGNMPLSMQVKLYRVLQEGRIRPLGSTDETEVDVRIIAATNKDLEKEIAEGRFRDDLFYRLSVIPMHLPPLRERRDDIPLLVRAFLDRLRKSMNKTVEGIEPEAMRLLEAYDWPGNVRELENTMERCVALETGPRVSVNVLPEKITRGVRAPVIHTSPDGRPTIPEGGVDLEKQIQDMEKGYIEEALRMSDGVGTRAAELLRMTYRSFRHYSKKYNL